MVDTEASATAGGRAGGPVAMIVAPSRPGPAPSVYHALVIGNNAYTHLPPLTSCVHDAEDMAALLSSKGYIVTLVLNGTRAGMVDALLRFQQRLRNGCTSVVLFSGHGFSCQTGQPYLPLDSYLVPVDGEQSSGCLAGAQLRSGPVTISGASVCRLCVRTGTCDEPDSWVSLSAVVDTVSKQVSSGALVVFLDACRSSAHSFPVNDIGTWDQCAGLVFILDFAVPPLGTAFNFPTPLVAHVPLCPFALGTFSVQPGHIDRIRSVPRTGGFRWHRLEQLFHVRIVASPL